jgi:hygromycin-B 4-O-kinase
MELQAQYFEKHLRTTDPLVQNLLACYQLRIGLEEMHRSTMEGRFEEADWALWRCRQLEYEG